jgi:hypothetical protein
MTFQEYRAPSVTALLSTPDIAAAWTDWDSGPPQSTVSSFVQVLRI